MIFSPFTGKDNHGKPVTFTAALLSDESTESYSWLFKNFVEAMGPAPKMIVTDQDRGMRAAIRTVLVDTKHRWCMWHIMLKLTDKVPKKTLENEDLKKEIRACVWSELIEPVEFEETWMGIMERYGLVDVDWFINMFENRKMWVPAYFRDFPMGSLIRTTSVSESENSFYKTFTRPRSNLVEFIMSFDHALAAQRNASSKLDYVDSTITPPFSTKMAMEKHASTMYTDHMFKTVQREMVAAFFESSTDGVLKDDFSEIYTIKDIYGKSWVVTYLRSDESYSCSCKLYVREGFLCSHVFLVFKNRFVNVIPEKYYNGRWLKFALGKAVHGNLGKELDAPVNVKQLAKNKAYRIFYGLIQKYEGDIDKITSFSAGMLEYDRKKESDSPIMSVGENGNRVEDFYSIERPALVEVQPPNVVQTKGSCSDSASRLVSAKEKAVVLASKPKRRCGKCRELRHHDSRNFRKNMETTKALVISSTISIFQHFLHC